MGNKTKYSYLQRDLSNWLSVSLPPVRKRAIIITWTILAFISGTTKPVFLQAVGKRTEYE